MVAAHPAENIFAQTTVMPVCVLEEKREGEFYYIDTYSTDTFIHVHTHTASRTGGE